MTALSMARVASSVGVIAAGTFPNLKTFTCGFDLSSASGLEVSFDERAQAFLPERLPEGVYAVGAVAGAVTHDAAVAQGRLAGLDLRRASVHGLLSGRMPWRRTELALTKAQARYARYGRWSLLLSWVPIIGSFRAPS